MDLTDNDKKRLRDVVRVRTSQRRSITNVHYAAADLPAYISEGRFEMHLIIRMPNGKRREVLVLAVGENRLRAVIAGHNDAVELSRNYGLWSSDLGEIDVEAITADDRTDMVRLPAHFCPKERAAGFEVGELTERDSLI